MKNSINLIAVILLFVILGCSCPKLVDLTKSRETPTPGSTPTSLNTSSTPTKTPAATGSKLTMEKFNQLKINMPMTEVDRILGGSGTEISTSTGGGVTFAVYKYSGENYTSIILTFKNDKIMSKTQVGLK